MSAAVIIQGRKRERAEPEPGRQASTDPFAGECVRPLAIVERFEIGAADVGIDFASPNARVESSYVSDD